MSSSALTYAVVTPARNEASNLRRLAECLTHQTASPQSWVIVDDGSTDETASIAADLGQSHSWIRVLRMEGAGRQERGGPVVRAFARGLAALDPMPSVVVKLDADLTFEDDYFERLLQAFEDDPALGIASGLCHELQDDAWTPIYGTRSHVWGAARAYRRECLPVVMPLEEREGWDEIDALKARLAGWETRLVPDLPFRHHRAMGQRDGLRRVWLAQGETAHYMGYRPLYLLVRTLYRLRREPEAALMLWSFAGAVFHRAPRLSDERVRSYLREQQRLRSLPRRAREARGQIV